MDWNEEPPTSDIDTPTPSTASSVAAADVDEGIESSHHKRKLSIDSSNEGGPTHKLPRATYKQARLNDMEADLGKNFEHGSTGDHTSQSDTSAHPSSFHPVEKSTKVNHKARSGTSESAVASRKLRKRIASGNYVINEARHKNWKEKITHLDENARFDPRDPQRAFHSRCSTWVRVKELGDTTRFKRHVETCQAKPVPARGTLMGMGWLKAKKSVEADSSGEGEASMPCRGLSEMDNPLVDRYLKRTGAGGGGGRSIHVISRERFEMEFKYLTRAQKDEVQATQRAEWAWRNDHGNLRVHSTNCLRFTSSQLLATSLCIKCRHLLTLKAFITAIRKQTPLEENLKYTNAQYLQPVLGRIYGSAKGLKAIIEHPVGGAKQFSDLSLTASCQDPNSTPCIRLAEAVLSGQVNNEVFSGLLEAMCTDLDKKERGVGLQNFRYAPAWDELCHIIYIISPRAHRVLRDYFPVRTTRSFR